MVWQRDCLRYSQNSRRWDGLLLVIRLKNVWRNIRGASDKHPDIYNKLKEMGFGEENDIQTGERVKEFFEFVEKNGRLPKYSVKEEKPLYSWYIRYLKNESNLQTRFPEVLAKIKELKGQ